MSELEGILWFLQEEKNQEAGAQEDPAVNCALTAFCHIFGVEKSFRVIGEVRTPGPFDLLQKLLECLEREGAIYVLGTLPKAAAIQYSWDQLGLDLFDLPWFDKQKAVYYLEATALFKEIGALQALLGVAASNGEVNPGRAAEQLKWAWPHRFARALQKDVGHDKRSLFQTAKWPEIRAKVDEVADRFNKHRDTYMPLAVSTLWRQIEGLPTADAELEGEELLQAARRVADLDCQMHRLAPVRYFTHIEPPSFKHVIILEDNPAFRGQLRKDLESELGADVAFADVAKSKAELRLYEDATDTEDLVARKLKLNEVGPANILTCYDLDLGADSDAEQQRTLHSGLWVMYGMACEYPDIPRLVITGFRSQDTTGYAAGGHAYLMKPYTAETLREQIRQSSVLRRVVWLCPEAIQNDYTERLCHDGAEPWISFESHVQQMLRETLRLRRVSLDVIGDGSGVEDVTAAIDRHGSKVVASDLFVIDLFKMNDAGPDAQAVLNALTSLRRLNPVATVVLVLPSCLQAEQATAMFFRCLPLELRSGRDAVLRKPMWIAANGHENAAQVGLADCIQHQLDQQNVHDVKYQVLIPVAAILRRCDWGYIQDASDQIGKINAEGSTLSQDELFAPLLPLLVKQYGLAGRLSDVANSNPTDWLVEAIKSERKIDGDRWDIKTDVALADEAAQNALIKEQDGAIQQVVNHFYMVLTEEKIRQHITLERWMRSMVDKRAHEVQVLNKKDQILNEKDYDTLTKPLAKLFGGATRYEFTVQGSWYAQGKRIDDILVVVEFAARSSLVARRIIKDEAVHYLSKVAHEELVMVQELPVRAHFWP
ncbi:MAG: hypothetical protein AAGG50_00585 [Bacteroidota bacterium]